MSNQNSELAYFLPVILVFAFSLMVILLTVIIHFKKSNQILKDWARDNQFAILESRLQIFNQGPLYWTTSPAQTVYYVKIASKPDAQIKQGYLRCGNVCGVLFSSKAEIHWD